MAAWKTIPSWFKLENYDECANFSLIKWAKELDNRRTLKSIMPGLIYDPEKNVESILGPMRNDLLNRIKNYGLFCTSVSRDFFEEPRWPSERHQEYFRVHENEYPVKRTAIGNLSQETAYRFYLDAYNIEEIERELYFARCVRLSSDMNLIKEKNAIIAKYSHPIATVADGENESYDDRGIAFLDINLDASNEQLLMEFKDWLLEIKGDGKDIVKRQFSKADLEGWHASRVLPYWDLTTIAALENATIPFHILGEALFPGEIGVDNAERVRKVTKKKSQFLFSDSVQVALQVQAEGAEAEKIKRNDS